MIGIGVGISVRSPSRTVTILAPVGGYVAAVTLHAMWNAAATLGTAETFLNVYFLVMVPIFIAGIMFVGWHRRREQKIVDRALPVMVGRGWVAERDIERLTNLSDRRAWRVRTARRHGKDAARRLGAYQAAVTELAFLCEARLIAALESAKAALPGR
jgi:hypothetical protein